MVYIIVAQSCIVKKKADRSQHVLFRCVLVLYRLAQMRLRWVGYIKTKIGVNWSGQSALNRTFAAFLGLIYDG